MQEHYVAVYRSFLCAKTLSGDAFWAMYPTCTKDLP